MMSDRFGGDPAGVGNSSGGPRPRGPAPGGPPYAEPPRRGRQWWFWPLVGCGGCGGVLALVLLVSTFLVAGVVQEAVKTVGPINEQTVKQALGPELPFYPESELEANSTQALMVLVRGIEIGARKEAGAIFKGLAVLETEAAADDVLAFYEKKLKAAGWKAVEVREQRNGKQKAFRKGEEMALVQVQPGAGGINIVLMRGGPDLSQHAPSQ